MIVVTPTDVPAADAAALAVQLYDAGVLLMGLLAITLGLASAKLVAA